MESIEKMVQPVSAIASKFSRGIVCLKTPYGNTTGQQQTSISCNNWKHSSLSKTETTAQLVESIHVHFSSQKLFLCASQERRKISKKEQKNQPRRRGEWREWIQRPVRHLSRKTEPLRSEVLEPEDNGLCKWHVKPDQLVQPPFSVSLLYLWLIKTRDPDPEMEDWWPSLNGELMTVWGTKTRDSNSDGWLWVRIQAGKKFSLQEALAVCGVTRVG